MAQVIETRNLKDVFSFFPGAWHKEIERVLKFNTENRAFLYQGVSGCISTKFDGMHTLLWLWTHESERSNGYARVVAIEVAKANQPNPTFARYRRDELNVARLFGKAGYEIVHIGEDNFIVVASRTL